MNRELHNVYGNSSKAGELNADSKNKHIWKIKTINKSTESCMSR